MDASFEEKSAWIQLVAMAGALGAYFAIAGIMLANGITVLAAFVPLFIASVVLLVVALTVGHLVAAIVRRPEPADERDRLIAWRSEANAAWIVGVGALLAVGLLTIGTERVWVAHMLLISLFAAELAKNAFQIRFYRAGV